MHEFIEKADRDKILTALKLIMFFFVKFSFPPINQFSMKFSRIPKTQIIVDSF
jgi:hypothetical protein